MTMESNGFQVDVAELERVIPNYDTAGPRYTSYPTAPTWSDDFAADDYRAALARTARKTDEGLALYAHVPFCRSLCHFCACNRVITRKEELPEQFLSTIEREIRTVRGMFGGAPSTTQLHWGGGTPTHLSPQQIERLFRAMTDAFPLRDGAEVSIEVDPRVTTDEHVAALADCGFNRISMGVQDLDDRVQQAIHRVQPEAMTRDLVESSRAAGMLSVNFDLIYGLPFQTVASFSHTLDRVLAIGPDRIALYAYAHVKWKAKQQRSFADADLPAPQTRLRIMLMAIERFLSAGYVYIGMDHFARPEDELCQATRDRTLRRNFMGYTTQSGVDLLGFGPSAISELQEGYAQSAHKLPEWEASVEQEGLATRRGYRLTEDDRRRRWVIASIFCHGEIDATDYEGQFGETFAGCYADELQRLTPMQQDGLLVLEPDGSVRLTSIGRLLVRNVAMTFDAHLPGQQGGSGELFSRTI